VIGIGSSLPVGRQVQSWAPMFFVYVIRSLTRNYIYVGLSNDYERRIREHNNGYERTTKPYRPFELILIEEFSTRPEARQREKYLKSGVGKAYLKGLK
jgi:putative endonuclease